VLPGGTFPGGTFPGGTLPGGTLPGGTFPAGTLPGGTLRDRIATGGAGGAVTGGIGPPAIRENRPALGKYRFLAGLARRGHSAFRREIEEITRPTMMISSTKTSRISAAS